MAWRESVSTHESATPVARFWTMTFCGLGLQATLRVPLSAERVPGARVFKVHCLLSEDVFARAALVGRSPRADEGVGRCSIDVASGKQESNTKEEFRREAHFDTPGNAGIGGWNSMAVSGSASFSLQPSALSFQPFLRILKLLCADPRELSAKRGGTGPRNRLWTSDSPCSC